jgi:glycosyltransferase involved in cell wall biosynthesis
LIFYLPQADIVFIQKKIFHKIIFSFIKLINEKIIFDFDDAIFVYKNIENDLINILRNSKHIVVGNEYLKNYVLKYNSNVSIIPTPVDCDKFRPTEKPKDEKQKEIIIGWTGMGGNLIYLKQLDKVFDRIFEKMGDIVKLKIISDKEYRPGIPQIINCKWNLNSEIDELKTIDIGIMPLTDDEFTKGKCGYKALLFMSLGIPVIASPVGVNKEIIQDGINGFLAESENEWIQKIEKLIKDSALRHKIGIAGRKTVEKYYSYKTNLPKLIEVFNTVYNG